MGGRRRGDNKGVEVKEVVVIVVMAVTKTAVEK